MERRPYRYVALQHQWKGQCRNIGVVVHSPILGYLRVMALDHGDLVHRLWDVPRGEVERAERVIALMREAGPIHAGRPDVLDDWAERDERVRLGTVHAGTSQHLRWALEGHFLDYAHPGIQVIS